MKFLFATDTHLRATSPRSRKDDYCSAILRKFEEIKRLAQVHKVDHVLLGGDLFDTSMPSLSVFVKIFQILSELDTICTVGSHDYRGYQETTTPETGVGYLQYLNTLRIADKDGVLLQKEGEPSVRVVGIWHTKDQSVEDLSIKKADEDYLIELVHGDLVLEPVMWPHILVSNVKTEADVVLVGHYHHGWGPVTMGKTVFAHPGSVARTEIGEKDVHPAVYIFSMPGEIEKVYLQDVTSIEDAFYDVTDDLPVVSFNEFLSSVQELVQKGGKHALENIVRTLGDQYKPEVVELLLSAIQECHDRSA